MTALDTRIEIAGTQELVARWHQAPSLVEGELLAATTEATLLLEREVKEGTPVGVGGGGGLRGSIFSEARSLGDGVLGVVSSPLAYAVPVELGTRPHFPPIQPLADWAQFKLGVPEAQARSVGFLIARAIARRGTEGAEMFGRAFEANRAQVERIYERARERILEALGGGAG